MRRTLTFAIAALALAAAPLATIAPAAADDVNVSVNSGGIAFGYSDGYWDTGHHWHQWSNAQQAQAWRKDNADHYYDRRHEQEKDAGWRDSDHWWDRH